MFLENYLYKLLSNKLKQKEIGKSYIETYDNKLLSNKLKQKETPSTISNKSNYEIKVIKRVQKRKLEEKMVVKQLEAASKEDQKQIELEKLIKQNQNLKQKLGTLKKVQANIEDALKIDQKEIDEVLTKNKLVTKSETQIKELNLKIKKVENLLLAAPKEEREFYERYLIKWVDQIQELRTLPQKKDCQQKIKRSVSFV